MHNQLPIFFLTQRRYPAEQSAISVFNEQKKQLNLPINRHGFLFCIEKKLTFFKKL